MNENSEVVDRICLHTLALELPHPVRVGINGLGGAGKTIFARRIAERLREFSDREVITASIDDFRNPASIRYARGRDSAEGFYKDVFKEQIFVESLLKPLGSVGVQGYLTKIFDVKTDTPIEQEPKFASPDAILIVEGVFLFKKEFLPYLDFKIFLDAPSEVALDRMLERNLSGNYDEDDRKFFLKRYMSGQKLYFEDENPRKSANIIIDNSDYCQPKIIKTVTNL